MNFYPYKPYDKTVSERTLPPMKVIPNQLELAPYLPLLAKEAHLQLAKAHMELADTIDVTKSPNNKMENMENTTNIVDYVQEQARQYISSKLS